MGFRRGLLGEFETNAVIFVALLVAVSVTWCFRPFLGGNGSLAVAWLILFPVGTCGAAFVHLRGRVRAGRLASARAKLLLERVPFLFLFFWAHNSIWRLMADHGVMDLDETASLADLLVILLVGAATGVLTWYGWTWFTRRLLATWPFRIPPQA